MRPDSRFQNLPNLFWANVRALSERIGYYFGPCQRRECFSSDAIRHASCFIRSNQLGVKLPAGALPNGVTFDAASKQIVVNSAAGDDVISCLANLSPTKGWAKCVESIVDKKRHFVALGELGNEMTDLLSEYLLHRCQELDVASKSLQNASQAEEMYRQSKEGLAAPRPAPINKQSGDFKRVSYLTASIQNVLDRVLGPSEFINDPRSLVKMRADNALQLTLSRWPDGLFPGYDTPRAIWEIKEHYHTTTFGSRVAAGVYETLLDGFEIRQAKEAGVERPAHIVFIDGLKTWWEDGKPFLCRLTDAMHMDLVDEIIFGGELLTRLPELAKEWQQT